MHIAVLDTDSIGHDLDYTPFERFGTVSLYPATSAEALPARVAEADCLILNKVKITAQTLACAPRLRLICIAATGYDNIDLAACRARGVAVCNVRGYSTHSVAQLTVAMALSLACRLPEYSAYVSDGSYTVSGLPNRLIPVYHELEGKTWGLLGYGDIARSVAQVARALGCHVLYCRKTPTKDPENVDIDTLCRRSDILSLHLPLTDETRGILSASRLAQMKQEAILINVARGAVLDEAAAAQAILCGRLGGLGCDVYTAEPFAKDHPYAAIAHHPRVCLTPHMAWGAAEARERLLEEIEKNISAFIDGDVRGRVDLP